MTGIYVKFEEKKELDIGFFTTLANMGTDLLFVTLYAAISALSLF